MRPILDQSHTTAPRAGRFFGPEDLIVVILDDTNWG
jgi:hypothetical protein